MAKTIMGVILIFMLALDGFGLHVKASGSENRATWLWNPWIIVNEEAATLEFLERKTGNKVYIQIDKEMSLEVYRSFIEKASSKGIRIYALDGAPDWVGQNGYKSQEKLMDWISTYQNGSTTEQKFSGVHLDVEPYLYSGWKTNQAKTIKSYQSLLEKAKKRTDLLDVSLEVDIPFWFDEISYKNSYGNGLLAEWTIAQTDSVTIMAYRDLAENIIDIVKNEMALAEKYGKPLVIGVETGQSSEGDTITFFEEGEAYMNEQLTAVQEHYAGVSSFNGVAIHHVGSWLTMNP